MTAIDADTFRSLHDSPYAEPDAYEDTAADVAHRAIETLHRLIDVVQQLALGGEA